MLFIKKTNSIYLSENSEDDIFPNEIINNDIENKILVIKLNQKNKDDEKFSLSFSKAYRRIIFWIYLNFLSSLGLKENKWKKDKINLFICKEEMEVFSKTWYIAREKLPKKYWKKLDLIKSISVSPDKLDKIYDNRSNKFFTLWTFCSSIAIFILSIFSTILHYTIDQDSQKLIQIVINVLLGILALIAPFLNLFLSNLLNYRYEKNVDKVVNLFDEYFSINASTASLRSNSNFDKEKKENLFHIKFNYLIDKKMNLTEAKLVFVYLSFISQKEKIIFKKNKIFFYNSDLNFEIVMEFDKSNSSYFRSFEKEHIEEYKAFYI